MSYRLKPAYWLKIESNKVESIISMPKYWLAVWTPVVLKTELAGLGLVYDDAQMTAIGAELVARGVLEQVT